MDMLLCLCTNWAHIPSIILLCGYLYRSFHSIQFHIIALCTYELRTLSQFCNEQWIYEICVTDIDDTLLPLSFLSWLAFTYVLHFQCIFSSFFSLSFGRWVSCFFFFCYFILYYEHIMMMQCNKWNSQQLTADVRSQDKQRNYQKWTKCSYAIIVLSLKFFAMAFL